MIEVIKLLYVLGGLLLFSISLLLLSIFLKDPYKALQDELEQMSILHIQEMYGIKKKIKIIEEELLTDDTPLPTSVSTHNEPNKKEVHAIIKNQVLLLAKQGRTVEQIAVQSSLTVEDVKRILTEKMFRGESL
ncbi:hypothetical protein [Cytobacillus purgationiresistens]|uniref:DUF2802 domain-containing protein n=1 Tax=Cytobacillus purgationiresistens TaxID=863449 RepID=A0ABU0AF18_9BACI|nr:hypothetical protein [Cytobacillus purgationiresistens]MDQ0269449.1 hypothetical protein [Cytobacillus purgationiresistens]